MSNKTPFEFLQILNNIDSVLSLEKWSTILDRNQTIHIVNDSQPAVHIYKQNFDILDCPKTLIQINHVYCLLIYNSWLNCWSQHW